MSQMQNVKDIDSDLDDQESIESFLRGDCSHCGEDPSKDHSICGQQYNKIHFTSLGKPKAQRRFRVLDLMKDNTEPQMASVEPVKEILPVEKIDNSVKELPAITAEDVQINENKTEKSYSPKIDSIVITPSESDDEESEDLAKWCLSQKKSNNSKNIQKPKDNSQNKFQHVIEEKQQNMDVKKVDSLPPASNVEAYRARSNCVMLDLCPNKNKCPYSHDRLMCRYGKTCKNKSNTCRFLHPGETSVEYQNRLIPPCRFGSSCRKHACSFRHPAIEKKAVFEPKIPNVNSLDDFPGL